MAHGCCPECGGAPCALRPVCPGEPPARAATASPRRPQPYGVMCRTCAPGLCDGSCDLPPFLD